MSLSVDKLPYESAAIVLWLPEGEKPKVDDFFVGAQHPPPIPNPEAWWKLGQAVISARTVYDDHKKVPWIKVGEHVLAPEDVLRAYEYFKNKKD